MFLLFFPVFYVCLCGGHDFFKDYFILFWASYRENTYAKKKNILFGINILNIGQISSLLFAF